MSIYSGNKRKGLGTNIVIHEHLFFYTLCTLRFLSQKLKIPSLFPDHLSMNTLFPSMYNGQRGGGGGGMVRPSLYHSPSFNLKNKKIPKKKGCTCLPKALPRQIRDRRMRKQM
jgi:hypothetical protein